ncbi:MAG: hypothetical protein NTV81_01555 [Candidatus Komeilibacteria bacterium]|nr:hypothetical protein [Candidatus Komeilibacteria bacterium]
MEFTPGPSDHWKKMAEDNLVYTQDIYQKVNKLYKHMLWQRVISWIYLAIIVVPIVASLFFLPSLIKGLTSIVDPSGSLQLNNLPLDKIIVPAGNQPPTTASSTGDLLKQYQQLLREIQR